MMPKDRMTMYQYLMQPFPGGTVVRMDFLPDYATQGQSPMLKQVDTVALSSRYGTPEMVGGKVVTRLDLWVDVCQSTFTD
eukprot:6485341-Amphidinium_carterae.1